jgi:hypothetical protein
MLLQKIIISLWKVWSDLKAAGATTDQARLGVRFHEVCSGEGDEGKQFKKNGNTALFPYNVPVASAGLKITSCAGLMDPQAWIGKYTCILFQAEVDGTTNTLQPKKPLVIIKEVPCAADIFL